MMIILITINMPTKTGTKTQTSDGGIHVKRAELFGGMASQWGTIGIFLTKRPMPTGF